MKRPAWLDERAPPLARRVALAPLTAAAWCYGAGAALQRASYERGWRRRSRLRCKVVSVGSLVVGGSGKTPLAAWIAAQLHARGRRVALATRGYGGSARDARVASDGERALERAALVGDEALLLAQLAAGVPVVVARRRALAGELAISRFGAELLVLDDGFQHHALARDLELVVFGRDGLGCGAVLPRGPLREPIGALARTNAILVTGGELPARDEALLARAAAHAARFRQ